MTDSHRKCILEIRKITKHECGCLTLTRGTLKATGSMVVLVSMSATAISTSRTLHSVLGRKAKPCRQEPIREMAEVKKEGTVTTYYHIRVRRWVANNSKTELSSVPCAAQESWNCCKAWSAAPQSPPHKCALWCHPGKTNEAHSLLLILIVLSVLVHTNFF